jgi:hypothetical protein
LRGDEGYVHEYGQTSDERGERPPLARPYVAWAQNVK